jgi:antitoxin PrlF
MITSRLSTKAQTTIPQPIRTALHLKEGDELVYRIEGDCVILSKARHKRTVGDPFRAFREWNSAADKKAYAKL